MFETDQLDLYKSFFKGRDDVFAIRWEKDKKSGYMPSYQFDPYMYRVHKAKGGSFKDYNDKSYKPLTDGQIQKHLNGDQLIGIYPMLSNNSSWFIAADFDKENWLEECRNFIAICQANNISAYLEISRSGNGGHVWIFFDQPYEAIKSRRIFINLLEQSNVFSIFDKDSSFDRLFPNQDYLSGKGLGNLIALPFHKPALDKGNSCFIDPNSAEPYNLQWEFLKSIKRTSITKLDELFSNLSDNGLFSKENNRSHVYSEKLIVRLSNTVSVNRSALSIRLINFLREELNFVNTEFVIKKRIGKNTWGLQRYFRFVEEQRNEVIIPRGSIGKLLRFCKDNKIEYQFEDERRRIGTVSFVSTIRLKEYQKVAFEACSKKDFGVIVAPPGSGKTIIGLAIIAEKKQPALIIVHRKQLADQWIERIESFLGIPKKDIGKVGQGKIKIGKLITVGMIQSLTKSLQSDEMVKLEHAFGTIIIDECHHVPAVTYRNTISKLHSVYLYGLTATPFRKYDDGKLIFIHLGEPIAEIKAQEIENQPRAKIIIRNTELVVPFNSKTDKFETLSKILVHDSSRNKLILTDILQELKSGKKTVIITERKEHIDSLHQYLKQQYETITLSGEDSESLKNDKWKILREGNFQVLITTGQYFGEGSDIPNITCVFLAYPFSFEGKLIQYIGRVQRSEVVPTIYDYRDYRIDYLERLFQKRNIYYLKLYNEGTLFDRQSIDAQNEKNDSSVEHTIKVAIEHLEFRFGAIAFRHRINEADVELEFEVENKEMRPEFEVLKPYFAKVLKGKSVKVDIAVRFHHAKPIFQSAFSLDLDKINQEIIDSVRFRFVSKNILGRVPGSESENMLNLSQVQSEGENNTLLYQSEEELLASSLNLKDAKHYNQLRYLAEKHDRSTLKIRFVLMPFSFVFLITGTQQYHIAWETLDTEEATYIWHIEKNRQSLKKTLNQINQDLGLIRNKGRQSFMEKLPANFSRIIHDYSDMRKGLVVWKGQLEERLV